MEQLAGKVAVITGGASGIGYGMAVTFAEAGMRVVVADIEGDKAEKVAAEVGGVAVATDVSDLSSVQALADRAFAEFGAVHLLCNNAGVSLRDVPLDKATAHDWEWVLGVNLDGVVNGVLAFLPRMREQQTGHIVNTSSMAGVIPFPGLGPYVATKYAVVALSEVLRIEAAEYGIGVSVLCPGNVRTGIIESERNRPHNLADSASPPLTEEIRRFWDATSIDPVDVGRMVRDAVVNNDAYVFTHKDDMFRDLVAKRLDRVMASFPPS